MTTKRAELCLTPALSKRLIARGVAALPQVRQAFEHGKLLISAGLTTGHIFVELTGAWAGGALACGMIAAKGACVGQAMTGYLAEKGHARFWYFEKGRLVENDNLDEVLEGFGAGDVFIKGANAIDSQGRVGVLLGLETGGLLGKAIGYVMAKGLTFILPVGLEKCVLGSLDRAASEMGTQRVDYSTGMPVGLIPVSGIRMTEIEALQTLADVEVLHVASGGSAGAEGSVMLLVKGDAAAVKKAVDIFRDLGADDRFDPLVLEPSVCAEHKWPSCALRNILYPENVKNKK